MKQMFQPVVFNYEDFRHATQTPVTQIRKLGMRKEIRYTHNEALIWAAGWKAGTAASLENAFLGFYLPQKVVTKLTELDTDKLLNLMNSLVDQKFYARNTYYKREGDNQFEEFDLVDKREFLKELDEVF